MKAAPETAGQQVIRPTNKPFKPTGGLVILRGNLAEEGGVLKVAGSAIKHFKGPARVFNCEEDAMAAVGAQKIKPGEIPLVTLIQGLPNAAHVLELQTVGDGPVAIRELTVHRPPLE